MVKIGPSVLSSNPTWFLKPALVPLSGSNISLCEVFVKLLFNVFCVTSHIPSFSAFVVHVLTSRSHFLEEPCSSP